MLKEHWKSNWFLASLISLAFFLANGSNALQSLAYKIFDRIASASHRDAENQITSIAINDQSAASIIAQPKVHRPAPKLAQSSAAILKTLINSNTPIQLVACIQSTTVASAISLVMDKLLANSGALLSRKAFQYHG